jgi:putative ABC transport system permease protein
MRAPWRLATSSLSGRRSRTVLLIATVALCSALIAAVACAMASVHAGVESRVAGTVGAADLRVEHVGRRAFDPRHLESIDAWPEVKLAVGRSRGAIALRRPARSPDDHPVELTLIGHGVDPAREYQIRPARMSTGRPVERTGEVVVDTYGAKELGAAVGDTLDVVRFGDPISLTLVGIVEPPALGVIDTAEAFVTLDELRAIEQSKPGLREIDIVLKPGFAAEAVARAHAANKNEAERAGAAGALELEPGVLLRVTAKITAGLRESMKASQVGLAIASTLSFLAAAFIILTGLTTQVQERQRELAVVRCIGGTRAQLAWSQILVGAIIGALGALVGTPAGVGGGYVLVRIFHDLLPAGFRVSGLGVVLAVAGAIGAGMAGAAWPAWRAARTSPLEALSVRAKPANPRAVWLCLVAGLAGAALHAVNLAYAPTNDVRFWADSFLGLPAMFAGYFLLSVPVMVLAAKSLGGLIARVLNLPHGLLTRTVLATPYRHGFTSAAMMLGLALLIALWVNGRAIQRDWLGALQFPDGFVHGLNLTSATQRRIEEVPGVTGTVAITLQPMKTDAFGLSAFHNSNTTFIAFEPEPFFRMTKLTWVQGDPATAQKRLEEGGAILVAREFLVTKGLGIGNHLTLKYESTSYDFEIVGVVNSPGLDIASQFFDIGDQYLDQAVNAVFGSRKDLVEKFGNDAINLIQIGIDPRADHAGVMADVRHIPGMGILSAGSADEVKARIGDVLGSTLVVSSVVAIGAMLVACLGVANLIVAGIQARQFEFGVLRAIGAQRALLTRLVMGEALLIAAAACSLGTVMGLHAAWGGQRMNRALVGIDLHTEIPWGVLGAGCGALTLITLLAACPAAWSLSRKHPRELLAATKG